MNDEIKIFKKRRVYLIGICTVIILLHIQLSIFLDKLFQHPLSQGQIDSLSVVLFFLCFSALLRYHQAARSSKSLSRIDDVYVPYKRKELFKKGIVHDRTHEGESEYTDMDWHGFDTDDYRTYNYILEEDQYFGGSYLKRYGKGGEIRFWEMIEIKWWRIGKAKLTAAAKFCLHEPEAIDIIWPYIFGVIALFEVTGMLKISSVLPLIGHWFNHNDVYSNFYIPWKCLWDCV